MRWMILTSLLFTSSYSLAAETWRSQVESQPLNEVVIQLSQSFSAEVISPHHTALSSELNARINHIHPRPGDRVKSGQILVELDCRDQQLQLERLKAQQKQTQANLNLAQLQVSRLKQLQARDIANRSQLDEAQTQVEQLQAQQQLLTTEQAIAQRQIDRCQIRAPFDGVVMEQQVGLGQWVGVGTSLIKLIQTQATEIEAQVPFSWLQNTDITTRPGQLNALFRAQGIKDTPLSLLRQSPNIEPRSRSVKLWFSADDDLPIGLSGQIILTQSQPYLPANVIVQRGNDFGVFILENNQLVFRVLDQAQEGRPHPVPANWSHDLSIITQGQQRLKRE
jgi:RND family efflux transporter MFP subunit